MLAPFLSSSTSPSVKAAAAAPSVSCSALPGVTSATRRTTCPATAAAAASSGEVAVPPYTLGSGVRAARAAAAALSPPVLLSSLNSCSAATLVPHQAHHHLSVAPGSGTHATANAAWDAPTEAGWQVAGAIRENDAAARVGTRCCTSLYVRAFQPEAVPLVETTAPAAAEHEFNAAPAALPAALVGTYAIGGAAAAQSAKAAILAAHFRTTPASVHIERMTQVLTAKLKADGTQELRHADPLLAGLSSEEGALSTARQKQQQWRQVELLQRQQELQHRLLVLQEQQRQRGEAAAADSEGWTSCRWISTDSDNAGEEDGRFSASDADARTASYGGPSESNSGCSMSFPKEPFTGEGFPPASPRSGFLEEPAHSTAAAGADHASATRENIQAEVGGKMRGRERRADFEFAASRGTAATSAAGGAVIAAASAGSAHAETSLQSKSNGLYFPYLLWQEDEDIEAAAKARAEPADTSTHAHSGNSSPVEEVTNEPLALGGAGATAAADAPTTPASNRNKNDKLHQKQICYPFPEAAVLWESSGSCCIDELSASAVFDEKSHQQLPQRQRLPLRHPCSAQQRDPPQEQESHEEQRTRQTLHSPEQQREVQRTVDSAAVLGSEWTDAGSRVLNSLEFPSASREVCSTHIGNSVADSGRGAAAGVAEVKATQVVHCPHPTCSSRLGRRRCSSTAGEVRGRVGEGVGSQSATTATAAEENSATAAAAAGTAEIPASPGRAGLGRCSIAAVAIRGQSSSVATARTATAGHTVRSSSSTRPMCKAAKRGATLQEALVELRRVTKTRAAATTGEATGKGTHLLLQGPAATASPLRIVPLHRHWVQQLLLQQKKQQQRVQRLQLQQQQQNLRQQRQMKKQQQQIKQQQQLQHNSEQRHTREERHPHQLSRGNRTMQQRKARKQSESDDRFAKMRGRSKTGNAVAAEAEEVKPLAHEKPSASSPQKPSCDAAAASLADKSGLPRTTRTACTLAARSALCASASAAASAAAAPPSAARVDPPVAFGNIALPCSGAATSVPAAADAGTAGLRGAVVASSAPPSRVAVPAAAAEGMPAPPVFDSESSLRDNGEVFLASLAAADTLSRRAAADHSLTTATAAAAQVQSSFTAISPCVVGVPSIPPFLLRDPFFSVPAANEGHGRVRAGCCSAATLAVDQEDESRSLLQKYLHVAIVPSAVPPARTATPVSHPSGGSAPTVAAVAAAAAVAGGVHVQAASAACLSSAVATVSAPMRTAQKARSTELPADAALNTSLLRDSFSLEGSRTALQRPRPSERRSHTCQAAAGATHAQRSDPPRKCARTAASAKNTAAATSGPGTTAVASALAVTTTGAETAVPRPVPRQNGTTVFTSRGTKERESKTRSSSTDYCRKSKSGRQTAGRQRSIDNSSRGEQQRSREKTAPSQPVAEGDSLRKKTVGRTKNAMQELEHSLKQQQQQGRQQQQEVVGDEFVVRGRQVVSRDVVRGGETQRERAQQQHDASNLYLRTDSAKKDRRVRNEVKTTGAVVFDEDTADLELQRTLRRLRTRLLLDTSEVGSPAMAQQDEEPADHPRASRRYHSRCSSGGRQQQDPSTSSRRSSHCGAAFRPPETALAAVDFSQASGRSNGFHILAASLEKGKEAAGESRGGTKDKLNLRTVWREMSNSEDQKDKGRGPPTDGAITASVTAPTIGNAAGRGPAKGRASAAGCGDRLQQLLTSTAGSNTTREQRVRQQKEQQEQVQQQWRPFGGKGETRKGTKSLHQFTGALGEAVGDSDLRFGERCDLIKSQNTEASTISSRCSSRSTQLSRSNQSNSSSTSFTPSTILRRLRRLLQKEPSPCCLSPRYRCRRRRRLKEQAVRREAGSSYSSKSGSKRCKRTRKRDCRTRNKRNTDNSRRRKRRDSSRCTDLSGSVNPSSASSCRDSSGSDSEGSSTSQRGNSSSGKEIAEASKRMWRTLLKRRNRGLASSSQLSRTSRHRTSVSSSSRRGRMGNSTSSLFTDSSSEASNTNTASSSCGARSSTFADKHWGGADTGFSASWIDRRPRNTQRKNLTAAADCIPAAGGAGVTSRGDAIDGIRAAFAGDAVAVEACTAAADGKGKDPAPSLISLWLQYSAAALEAANQQQQQQGILTAAAGGQQLKKEVLVERRQRSLKASDSDDMQATSSRQARSGGKSKSGNWRRRYDSNHRSKGISRSGRKDGGLWHNSSRRSGSGSSSTSESMRLSDRIREEDAAFSSDPDAFIRRIKRRLRLPVSPRLKNRQQQQRQRQDSSQISGSSSRYLAIDNTEKHRWTHPGQSQKHVQPLQQQPVRQQHEQERIWQQQERQQDGVQENQAHSAEEGAKVTDRKADVDREQQQREEKQNPEEIVCNQESGGLHLREDAVELQHEQERQRTAVTSAATTGAGAGIIDDPSGPLHLSALGSPVASPAKRHMKGQLCRQQEDKPLQEEQEKQEPGNCWQFERELPQKEGGKEQPAHAKQQRNQNEPSQQEQEAQEGRGVHKWINCICTAGPAADDDAVTNRGAGATLDTGQILHASLASVAPPEGGQTEILAAVQVAVATPDGASRTAIAQAVAAARTAVSAKSEAYVTAESERIDLSCGDQEVRERTDGDGTATARGAPSGDKGRKEQHPQLRREQHHQRNVSAQEKEEASERQAKMLLRLQQEEARIHQGGTQQQDQQHGETQELHEGALEQNQPDCGLGHEQSAPAVEAKEEESGKGEISDASHASGVLQSERLLGRPENEDVPSEQQQPSAPTDEVHSVAHLHTMTVPPRVPVADLANKTFPSPSGKSTPWGVAAAIAAAVEGRADAAATTVTAASEDTYPLITGVTGGFGATAARAEDPNDDSLTADVAAKRGTACTEARGDTYECSVVPSESAALLEPCVAFACEQQTVAGGPGSGSAESPAVAVAAARGLTSMRYASSVESFSFSLSSSSGSSSAVDHADHDPIKHSFSSVDSSSSHRAVNPNLTNNSCIRNTRRGIRESVNYTGRRIPPGRTTTAENSYDKRSPSTNTGAAAQLRSDTEAGGRFCLAASAEGEAQARDTAGGKIAGAARPPNIRTTCNNSVPAATLSSGCLLPENLAAPRATNAEKDSPATSAHRESAAGAIAELSAGSEREDKGSDGRRKDSCIGARGSGASACVQQQLVPPDRSFDRSNDQSRQTEVFVVEQEEKRCFLHNEGLGPTPTVPPVAHGNFDEVAAAAAASATVAASSFGHVAVRAACPDGRAAETCAAARPPLVCAAWQSEQRQEPQQLDEAIPEVLLEKEAPPGEVLALLKKQQQRQLHLSTAGFLLPTNRCTCSSPASTPEREKRFPLRSLNPATQVTQQEAGRQERTEQQKCDEQQWQNLRHQKTERKNKLPREHHALHDERRGAGLVSALIAAIADESACRGEQAGRIREGMEGFAELVNLMLGGGENSENSLANTSSAARSTAAAFTADRAAALPSSLSATVYEGNTRVERTSHAAQTGPRTCLRECMLGDATASVSVPASAAASLPAAFGKVELFAAVLAELQQFLREKESFPFCGLADSRLQPLNTCGTHIKSGDVGSRHEQSHVQPRKCGAKRSKKSIALTVAAARNKKGTGIDTAAADAGEWSCQSKRSSHRVCDGVGTRAAQRKEGRKAAAQRTCPEGSEEAAASAAQVIAESCGPQIITKDRRVHGAGAGCSCCSALQMERTLSAATRDVCAKRYRRVLEHAPKKTRRSPRRLSSRCEDSRGGTQLRCSRGHANRADSVESRQHNSKTNSRTINERPSSDSMELSATSTRGERSAGNLYHFVRRRAAVKCRSSRDFMSSSSKRFRSRDVHNGCPLVYSGEFEREKLESSSGSASSCGSRRSSCSSEYARQATEERGSAQMQQERTPRKAAEHDNGRRRRARRLHHQRHCWRQQQQQQHHNKHRLQGGTQEGADGVEDRAGRSSVNVEKGRTGRCCAHDSQQQEQPQQQWQQTSCGCKRKAGHTSSRRHVLQESPYVCLSPSLLFEQKRTGVSPHQRGQQIACSSSFPQDERRLLTGVQQLLQQREELPTDHNLAWCWREWGGCEIYKQQRSRLQAVLREALKGHD